MNERIRQLAEQAGFIDYTVHNRIESKEQVLEKFAQLIMAECVRTLEFHGFDEAVPYIEWMATNRMGIMV